MDTTLFLPIALIAVWLVLASLHVTGYSRAGRDLIPSIAFVALAFIFWLLHYGWTHFSNFP